MKVHSDMSKVCLTHAGNRPLKRHAAELMQRNPPRAMAIPYFAVDPIVCSGFLLFISMPTVTDQPLRPTVLCFSCPRLAAAASVGLWDFCVALSKLILDFLGQKDL